MGECRRPPGRCKFRHVKQDQELDRTGHLTPGSLHQNMHLTVGNPHSGLHSPFSGHPHHHSASTPVYHHPHQGLAPPAMNGNGFNLFANPHTPLYAATHQSAAVTPAAANAAGFRNSVNHISPSARPAPFDSSGYPDAKRPRYEPTGNNAGDEELYAHPVLTAPPASSNPAAGRSFLEEENAALRRRIEELKKQNADLMATNDFLLEQNASLRSAGAVTVGFTAAGNSGLNAQPSAAASVAVASNAAQQAVASAVAAAAAANAAGATCSTSLPPTSVTLELPVASLAPLAPVFSAAAGLPVSCVSSIAAALSGSQSAPVVSGSSSSTFPVVSYPVVTPVVSMGRGLQAHQMPR